MLPTEICARDEVVTEKCLHHQLCRRLEEFSVLVSDDDALGNTKTQMYVVPIAMNYSWKKKANNA